MSLSTSDTENLSPKAAAFSIASLLTKTFDENSSTRKTSELNPPLMDLKEKGNWWKDCQRDKPPQKTKSPSFLRLASEDHSIKNILNNEQPLTEKYGEIKRSGLRRNTSILDPLQQFAACCDLVRNLDTFKNTSSYCPPQRRVMELHREVQVAMQQSDLWWKFYACGTEMVITRTGRWEKFVCSDTLCGKIIQTFLHWKNHQQNLTTDEFFRSHFKCLWNTYHQKRIC